MPSKIAEFLNGVNIGEPQTHANMAVYPLHMQNGHQRGYQTLDEAMAAKTVEILEVSESGSVPTLAVRNTGALPILLVVGEELIGARQNRVLNTSLLVPAKSDLQIPVSCVERGRWSYRSRGFSSSTTTSHLKLRKEQTKNVTESLRASPVSYDANQSKVWQEIERKITTHGSTSSTRAMHDMYEQNETQIKEYLSAFTPPEAEGLMVAINGRVVGADLFDHHETLRQLWPKLMRSYAVDALERREPAPEPAFAGPAPDRSDDTQQFLRAAESATDEIYDSVGMGKDIRLSSEAITGSGLLWEDKLIHASLFSARV
jgi:hypothetical protein